jgi:hypothetical protein
MDRKEKSILTMTQLIVQLASNPFINNRDVAPVSIAAF